MTVYFDAASSAPPHPVAREALLAAWDEGWADPARLYREGRRARMLLDSAREAMAEQIGCRPDELSFTSSGTRALHTAVAGTLAGRRRTGRRLLVSAVEHSAVLHAAAAHEQDGGAVTEVAPDTTGRTAAGVWATELTRDTALACLQSANHETGTQQPVGEVAALCRDAGVPLLVDAAQSLPWQQVPGEWSLLTGSAHKWGGPAGVGLLAVRKGVRFATPQPTDDRESGRSPGFPPLPAVVAAAASLRAVRQQADAEAARLWALVDRLRAEIPHRVPDAVVVGDPEHRLPHIVTFSCLYADGEALLHGLDQAGFAVSSGSSCTSDTLTPSHVLRAMGVLTEGNVRVSLPRGTEESEVERFLQKLPEIVATVRGQLDAPIRGGLAEGTGAGGGSDFGGAAGSPDSGAGTGSHSGAVAADRTSSSDAPTTPLARERSEEGAQAPVGQAAAVSAGITVDALGRRCPIPVIELARVIGSVPVGGVVTVLADDAAARLDIPAWCEMRKQEYLGEVPDGSAGDGVAYRVRRIS